ncbi:MAG: Hsp20/alpha crystallin family protein [Candidatus Fimimonas sp.]
MKTYMMTRKNNDLIDDAFNSFFRPFYVDDDASIMKTDISENEKEYLMDVEMAGFDKSDIALKFENGYLTVSAKKQEKEEDKKYIRRERAFSCSRSYYLGDVNEKLIKAKYENGILQIVVPKQKPEEVKHTIIVE